MKMILITGAAGFIGFHLSKKILDLGVNVVGVDNLNNYYDVNLKRARLKILQKYPNFQFIKLDLHDVEKVKTLFETFEFEKVVNLAAQAGVRHSIEKPFDYIDSNIIGFMSILEGCRHFGVKHLVYASSSSVYGANTVLPFSEKHGVDHPLAIYGATKRFNELAAHSYSNLYHLPTTGLRFFSVYGPWGRPDMALFKFTKNIIEEKPIDVYNNGKMTRDFTYIDDIVEGVSRAVEKIAAPSAKWKDSRVNSPDMSYAPFSVYNIGNGKTVQLMDYIRAIEDCVGKKAIINMLPMQDGDVPMACSDVSSLIENLGYHPKVQVKEGVRLFVDWYRNYYKV